MRALPAAVLSIVLTGSGAFAAEPALAPGKPAGVHTAQMENSTIILVAGAAVVAAAVAVAVSGDDNNNVTATATTTTTSP
ncbi:MAG TPA: hypothetical protein VGC16_06075 [Rhizomicrobium sp.]